MAKLTLQSLEMVLCVNDKNCYVFVRLAKKTRQLLIVSMLYSVLELCTRCLNSVLYCILYTL